MHRRKFRLPTRLTPTLSYSINDARYCLSQFEVFLFTLKERVNVINTSPVLRLGNIYFDNTSNVHTSKG